MTDLPPHEWLLYVMHGGAIVQKKLVPVMSEKHPDEIERWVEESFVTYPTMKERLEAAKAAAPYYAPRAGRNIKSLDEALKLLPSMKDVL